MNFDRPLPKPSATITPAVTRTEIVEVEPEKVVLKLTRKQAEDLMALCGALCGTGDFDYGEAGNIPYQLTGSVQNRVNLRRDTTDPLWEVLFGLLNGYP